MKPRKAVHPKTIQAKDAHPTMSWAEEYWASHWRRTDPFLGLTATERRFVRAARAEWLNQHMQKYRETKGLLPANPPTEVAVSRSGSGAIITWEDPEPRDGRMPHHYWVQYRVGNVWVQISPSVRAYKPLRLGVRSVSDGTEFRVGSGRRGTDTAWSEPVGIIDGRKERIIEAVRTFRGQRTKRGYPYLRYLRSHAGIGDITAQERDSAARAIMGKT